MAANTPTDAEITAIAAEYSLPPAILWGLVSQMGTQPGLGLSSATLGAYMLSASDVADDPILALTVAARTLAQTFNQTGSWGGALSVYLAGSADAWQSPTGSVGGQVAAILGQAALQPTFGISGGFVPTSLAAFSSASRSFGTELQQMSTSGGAVTPESVSHYRAASAQISSQQFSASANMQQVATDILTAAKIPVTEANIAVITTMARGEGMPLGDFNWLATTQGQGQTFNSVGVRIFPTYQAGIDATAQTLLNGNYQGMVNLMRQGADLKTIASNPEVQANLRTWQGGSNEDVNLLGGLANVPGASPAPATPKPDAVGEFAAQLQSAGVDPQEFSANFAFLAGVRRKLLGSQRTSVTDYAQISNMLKAKGLGVDEGSIAEAVRAQPHPTYPNVTAGAFADTFDRASLYSVMHTGQMPTNGEVARLAGLDNKEVISYYQQKASTAAKAAPGTPVQPQQQGKLLQMSKTA
jgi:hypothetical protein